MAAVVAVLNSSGFRADTPSITQPPVGRGPTVGLSSILFLLLFNAESFKGPIYVIGRDFASSVEPSVIPVNQVTMG